MATLKKSDMVQAGNFPLPQNKYSLRVKKATFGPSKSSGNPTTAMECEIVWPKELELADGSKASTDGFPPVRYYISYTEKGQQRARSVHEKLGAPLADEFDNENINPSELVGKVFDALLSSKAKFATMAPRAGQSIGDFILDADGNKQQLGYEVNAQVDSIFGLTSDSTLEQIRAVNPSI